MELGKGGSDIIAAQVPYNSSKAQLAGKIANFSDSKIVGRSIVVVDQFGTVLIPLQPMSNFRR